LARNKRRIAVVSGKRGGFGAMLPLMKAIDSHEDMEMVLIVTDQHLYKEFGETVKEVERWFKVGYKLYLDQKDDSPLSRASAIGKCLDKMAYVLDKCRPDILLILGDRGEVLAAVVAAINLKIPVAHIQGGDISGSIDEFVRHAITKMSHIHFPSTKASAERIKRMGEEEWRIHVVGDCHLDEIAFGNFTPQDAISGKFSLDLSKPVILTLQHPVTTESEKSYEQMKATCDALRRLKHQTIMVYPCSDHGYKGTIRAIKEIKGETWVRIYKNIDCYDFWGLENVASVFVGNSSAGLIETPFFKLPSVTIGKRQEGRERAENCIYSEPMADDIYKAINHCLYDEDFKKIVKNCSQPFGDGYAWKKMLNVLSSVELGPKLFEKKMTY
jgi:GDP/UDP-N,N'-diacetylbacillosamine 2-epimerase (hydrolysing)